MSLISNSDAFNDVWEYNIDTDTWTQKTSDATARNGHTAICYNDGTNNKMVTFGGTNTNYTVVKSVWVYNISTANYLTKYPNPLIVLPLT